MFLPFQQIRPLSPFACHPDQSRGRFLPESPSPTRSPFQRDRDRVLHSNAFRRLKHKTQVFIEHEGDHYRTRLTHSMEVGQIARSMARVLGLDEDLAETLALAHDLGHTPFGHAGEDALAALMAGEGGFDHNAQALRIVTQLEKRYAAFDGLNLTWESLEGLVKHNGPIVTSGGSHQAPLPFLRMDAVYPLALASFASAEAQVAALADDIAYNAHDLDDGLRARLFDGEALREVPFLHSILEEISSLWPDLAHKSRNIEIMSNEVMRRVITRLVEDGVAESTRRLLALAPPDVAAIRGAGEALIAFSPKMREEEKKLKAFLFSRMYRHEKVMKLRQAAAEVVNNLFNHYLKHPNEMGEIYVERQQAAKEEHRFKRLIADYIAGMTDRFAILEHQRLFKQTPLFR